MERVRWDLALAISLSVVVLSGCAGMPWKVIKRQELERLRQSERLNARQAGVLRSLAHEKDTLTKQLSSLTSENEALQAQLVDKGKLLGMADDRVADLTKKLEDIGGLAGEGVSVLRGAEGVIVRIKGDLLFPSGKASLTAKGKKVLTGIAAEIQNRPNDLRICGYTDSDPITYSGWKSNFELSGARALSVLNHLVKQGIDPGRVHFAGYGEHNPILENGKENKKRSRRAEIILLHDVAAAAAEASAEK